MRLRQGFKGAWIALLAVALDRASKAAVLRLEPSGALVPGVLNLTPVENAGMAFSMFSGRRLALIVVAALLVVGLLAWLLRRPGAHPAFRAGLWLILGGGLGNLFDRIVRGTVTDFLEFAFVRFAVFNVADACVCLGAALAVIGAILEEMAAGHGPGSR